MASRWEDTEAERFRKKYAPRWGEALALRLYTSRLIGSDSSLVLHGGGNTSVKDTRPDFFSRPREVLFVKGSGWDLAAIEPEGFPALDLAALLPLRSLAELSDEEMVNQLRTHLLDAGAPTPSIEALLHAFLPHRFVDHSHAGAILALSNQEEGERWVREALGERVAALPWIQPGFPLAVAVARAVEEHPGCEGAVLHRHGLFTFGETARESFERHVALVERAREFLAARGPAPAAQGLSVSRAEAAKRAARLAPVLRGVLSRTAETDAGPGRFLLTWSGGTEIRSLLEARHAAARFDTPPLTPDHAIRIKGRPCFLEGIDWDGSEEAMRERVEQACREFADSYRAYREAGVAARGPRKPLDPAPRLILVPGCGLFAAGTSVPAARIARDLGLHNLEFKAAARGLGPYRGLSDLELFDMEYWPLEQAKLGRKPRALLEGQVAVITGGAGAVGEGIAEVLAEAGAAVVVLDREGPAAAQAAARLNARTGAPVFSLEADVTVEASLEEAFEEICRRHGGLDVLIPCAGAAAAASLLELSPRDLRRLFEVNQLGVQLTLRAGGRILHAQGTGGSVVIVSSKNVLAPGAGFGAYSSTKAGAHQLGRVAALEWAAQGIHVNMVCPDAVFGHGENPSRLWQEVGPRRARSRGLAPEELEDFYVQRNLLKRRVTARDVGRAVLFFASRATPTTGAVLPVDGGIAAAFPR
ncbi:MAG: bifunctional aldolase/short-chain dehydrogenase [Planctomycetota bacterium]